MSLEEQVATSYWTRTWASTATVIDIAGRAVEDGSYDAEAIWSLTLPDTSCVNDWLANGAQEELSSRLNNGGPQQTRRIIGGEKDKQKLLIDLEQFRKDAESGLSCVLTSDTPTESRSIRGHLDFFKVASTMRISLQQ